MPPSSRRSVKKILGMTGTQISILAILVFLFCLLVAVLGALALSPTLTLPAAISNLPYPSSPPSTLSPTSTPTNTLTNTPTNTPTDTPTSTPTATFTPSPSMTPTKGVPKPPDTTENIHVAQIFNAGIPNPGDETGKVDIVWGSEYPDQPPGVFNLYYYPFDRDADGEIGGTHHDITWFLASHPDWIEYKCDKKTPAYEYDSPNVPLDISNPEVIDYMIHTYLLPAIEKGYQGIAFDNVDFNNYGHRCGVWRNGAWIEQPGYIVNVLRWAHLMYTSMHAMNVSVAMNFSYDLNHPTESNQIYRNLDIALDERGFTNSGGSQDTYFSGETWLTYVNALQRLDAGGRGFVSINEFPESFEQISQDEKQWALANYLLVKGRYSYIAITGQQEYGVLLTAPEYSAPIGHALNDMYQSQGVSMRDFSNGKAIVNPTRDKTVTLTFPGSVYQDLYGKYLETITLKPLSGIVLLGKSE
jgi:hypothetical protein